MGRHRRFVTAMAVDAIGSGVFMPISVLYFLTSTSLSLVQIGMALSLASALRLPFAPMVGGIVDRIGARQILLVANLIQAVGFVGYVFADSFATVLVASAVVQVGQTAFWGSFSPVVAEISEPGERERWFGFLGALRNASFAIGGLVAAFAITVGTTTAYSAVVLANAGSYLLAFLLLLSVEKPPLPIDAPTASTGPEQRQGWRQVLRDRPYLLFVLTNFSFATSAMALNIAIPVYITQSLGLPGWVAGAVFTINTVMIGLGQGLVVNAMEGSVRTNIVSLGALLFVASYAVMFAADWAGIGIGIAIMLIGAVVYTAGELVAGPVLSALSTDAAPAHLLGRYASLYQMSWTVSSTVAPVTMTWLLQRGSAPLWLGLSVIALLGVALSQLLRRVMPPAAMPVPVTRSAQSPVRPNVDEARSDR
ncbi:MAG: MFS transporter [Nocardioidaceae bacterium]|nr:MFS transporter [Nocardioidaceae bacterium]